MRRDRLFTRRLAACAAVSLLRGDAGLVLHGGPVSEACGHARACRRAVLRSAEAPRNRAGPAPRFRAVPLTRFGFACRVEGSSGALALGSFHGGELAQLAELFEEYSVLVFKSAAPSEDELIAFAGGFAACFPGAALEASETPAGGRGASGRLVGRIANFDIATGEILPAGSKLLKLRSGNGLWHIDSSFKVLPALASLMCGVVVPEPGDGGETEFASSRAALAALPDDLEPAELSRLI
ncbi:unnamed protein product, partial [Effrenium voratum]